MFTATTAFSKKHYALLGKLLLQKEPETAHKLLSKYLPDSSPQETDVSRIDLLFNNFCSLKNINPSDHTGALYKSSKMDIRKQFIAVVVQLYSPQAFRQPLDSIILSQGLLKALCSTLKYSSKGSMHGVIREAIMWQRNYEEFRTSVESIIEKLTNGTQG